MGDEGVVWMWSDRLPNNDHIKYTLHFIITYIVSDILLNSSRNDKLLLNFPIDNQLISIM
jgi:hypothetical protein